MNQTTKAPKKARYIPALEIAKPRFRNKASGRTGHSALRSMLQNSANSVGAVASVVRTGHESQPMSRPNRSPIMRQISPPANVSTPVRSKAGPFVRSAPARPADNGRSRSRKSHARTRAATMKGTLPQKTHCQSWSNQPAPTSSPAPMVPPTMPMARLPAVKPMLKPRRWGGKRLAAMAGATAYIQAVPMPCSTRNPTTDARSGDRAMQNIETR